MEFKKNYLIFTIPFIVFIFTLSICLIAIRYEWTGQSKQTTTGYCEKAQQGWIKEPINTWSCLGFIVIGLIIASQMQWGSLKNNANIFTRSDFMPIFFSSLVICLGPGSMVMHATYTQLGGQLDHLSMSFVAAFLVAYSGQRLFCTNIKYFAIIFIFVLITCEISVQLTIKIPMLGAIDNLVFAIFILLTFIIEILIVFYQHSNIKKRWGIACLCTFLISFFIWNLSKNYGLLCDPNSLFQGHATWHLLDALALYFLFLYYISENNTDQYYLLEETK
ncbi:hypothetical protein I4U23_016033 [Adineta vaga]|nr:hypothetical protein I4U23_016033 [Adineta vaga]